MTSLASGDPRARTLEALTSGTARLVVVGLGSAGLPVACAFATAGYRVTGVDLDPRKVALVNEGIDPNGDPDPDLPAALQAAHGSGRLRAVPAAAQVGECDVVVLLVPTPVGPDRAPDHGPLRRALGDVGPLLRPGVLLVVESTLAPGTMRDVVAPEVRRVTGLEPGRDIALAHVPERLMPGRALRNIRTHPRALGAEDGGDAEVALALYRSVVQADIDVVDPLTAEMVKTAENAYRDVQIAFANELALLCDAAGADVWRVRDLVNRVPRRDVHDPGPGVGGQCIPKDPWLLAAASPERATLLRAARAVNDRMPAHAVALLREILDVLGVPPADARVALLGLSYLEGTDDRRNAPSTAVEAILRAAGVVDLRLHDPEVREHAGPLDALLEGVDVAVVLVAHRAYRTVDWSALAARMRHAVVLDTRNVVDAGTSYSVVKLGASARGVAAVRQASAISAR